MTLEKKKKKKNTNTQLHEVILYLYYICTHSHITLLGGTLEK